MASSNTTKIDPAKATNEKSAGEGSSSKQAETKVETTTNSAATSTKSTINDDKSKKDAEKAAETGKATKAAETKKTSAKEVADSQKAAAKKVTFLKAKKKKRKVVVSESTSDADDDSDSSDSETERKKLKEKAKKAKARAKEVKSKKKADPKDSDSDSSDVAAEKKKLKKKARKSKSKAKGSDSSDSSSDASDSSDSEDTKTKEKNKRSKQKEEEESANAKKKEDDEKTKTNRENELGKAIAKKFGILDLITTKEATKANDDAAMKQQLAQQQLLVQLMQQQMQQQTHGKSTTPTSGTNPLLQLAELLAAAIKDDTTKETAKKEETAKETEKSVEGANDEKKSEKEKEVEIVRASVMDFKRVDRVYDRSINDFKYQPTTNDNQQSVEYDQYIFNVRRAFDYTGKYSCTRVDVKSKLLIEALKEIMGGIEGLSLVDDTPKIDPNLLFLYLEDLRKLYKKLKKRKITAKKHKKQAKKDNETKRTHLKLLLKYLDKDYSEIKKSLYPMLEAGLITFEYLWTLWKPDTIAWATTYNTLDQPRAFKMISYEKKKSVSAGEYYLVEGKYLEYDGKTFGMGDISYQVFSFKGAQKISSLDCYPIKYHKNETKARAELIARGKKFVSLHGVQYKAHEGLAYVKRQQKIIKINIDSRIMVDPAIFRRTLPNYQISAVKAQDPDIFEDGDSEEGSEESDSHEEKAKADKPKTKRKVVQDSSDSENFYSVYVPVNEDGMEIVPENLKEVVSKKKKGTDDKKVPPKFKDEEYLIASPVVLGFSFAEKGFLEFTVSGVKEIAWNEGSYESLVLPENTKEIVQGLVESHKNHPEEGIDDVIQGKGKGLVAVLHGPPGTGKTLTAEGISELLKCPLYMVSVGELGTSPKTLEAELQRVLDIAHAWGAVLLLDEADFFLEQRKVQDIHRNALVSIFLRLLEYFQGVLFLTTNRVATFDEAFQSRIHNALKYNELDAKAKRAIFKLFIERVRVSEGLEVMPFTEQDLDQLVSHNLNGRQIKNTVRTAQALAINKGELLSMEHLKRVLAVSKTFDDDIKGGAAHRDMFN